MFGVYNVVTERFQNDLLMRLTTIGFWLGPGLGLIEY